MQRTGTEGPKLALALLLERRNECPGAVPILAVHDEIVVECDEADAQQAKAWLERAMIDGMDEVLNGQSQRAPVFRSRWRPGTPRPGPVKADYE